MAGSKSLPYPSYHLKKPLQKTANRRVVGYSIIPPKLQVYPNHYPITKPLKTIKTINKPPQKTPLNTTKKHQTPQKNTKHHKKHQKKHQKAAYRRSPKPLKDRHVSPVKSSDFPHCDRQCVCPMATATSQALATAAKDAVLETRRKDQ